MFVKGIQSFWKFSLWNGLVLKVALNGQTISMFEWIFWKFYCGESFEWISHTFLHAFHSFLWTFFIFCDFEPKFKIIYKICNHTYFISKLENSSTSINTIGVQVLVLCIEKTHKHTVVFVLWAKDCVFSSLVLFNFFSSFLLTPKLTEFLLCAIFLFSFS